MRKLVLALAGAALVVLTACDPTKKFDYRCMAEYGGQEACIQFRITEAEGNVANVYCNDNFGAGAWAYHACEATHDGGTRVPGYCQVDAASGFPSDGPVKVFFYDPPVTAGTAPDVCSGAGGDWQSP